MIACGFCDADAYYYGPYTDGNIFVLLRADLLRRRAPISAARTIQIITYVTDHYPLDHRTALLAYLSYLRCFFYTEGATITARTAGGEWLYALFDATDRLIELAPGHRP